MKFPTHDCWESFFPKICIIHVSMDPAPKNDPPHYKSTIMLSQPISATFTTGEGQPITIETGKLARQADGAVTLRQGNCIILSPVVANREPREGQEIGRA